MLKSLQLFSVVLVKKIFLFIVSYSLCIYNYVLNRILHTRYAKKVCSFIYMGTKEGLKLNSKYLM